METPEVDSPTAQVRARNTDETVPYSLPEWPAVGEWGKVVGGKHKGKHFVVTKVNSVKHTVLLQGDGGHVSLLKKHLAPLSCCDTPSTPDPFTQSDSGPGPLVSARRTLFGPSLDHPRPTPTGRREGS